MNADAQRYYNNIEREKQTILNFLDKNPALSSHGKNRLVQTARKLIEQQEEIKSGASWVGDTEEHITLAKIVMSELMQGQKVMRS